MAHLKWYFFGPPKVEYSGRPHRIDRRKAIALAAYLSVGSEVRSRERLSAILWPNLPPEQARAALRSTLPTLTTLAKEPWLEANRSSLRLNPQWVWSDVREFMDRLERVRLHHHPLGQPCQDCRL
ncbi:MAG: hypothetical protein K6T57_14605 [Thermaceae bacterium]|nr:hypothetical protein [Thermaceae bacterium]